MSTVTQQPGSYRHLDEQYLQKYGVKCAECGQLFVGKVLQAREKKYHPSCAKCSRCGGPFVEGDEMCIKGDFCQYCISFHFCCHFCHFFKKFFVVFVACHFSHFCHFFSFLLLVSFLSLCSLL